MKGSLRQAGGDGAGEGSDGTHAEHHAMDRTPRKSSRICSPLPRRAAREPFCHWQCYLYGIFFISIRWRAAGARGVLLTCLDVVESAHMYPVFDLRGQPLGLFPLAPGATLPAAARSPGPHPAFRTASEAAAALARARCTVDTTVEHTSSDPAHFSALGGSPSRVLCTASAITSSL
jgi:hypothetical protein